MAGFCNSAVASQPCTLDYITADKRKIKDYPKLQSVASFIRKALYAIAENQIIRKREKI